MTGQLLHQAIEDNVAWCRVICAVHGSFDDLSASTWSNRHASPPYYPNIITRRPGAQTDVLALIEKINGRIGAKGWGIKDSFCDLSLWDNGFFPIVEASWYGGILPEDVGLLSPSWERVTSPNDLALWELAWGGDPAARIFLDPLLADERITFWYQRSGETIEAGFISFASGSAVGVSNWFAVDARRRMALVAVDVVAPVFSGLPVVFWSAETLVCDGTAVSRLGPLRVWLAES